MFYHINMNTKCFFHMFVVFVLSRAVSNHEQSRIRHKWFSDLIHVAEVAVEMLLISVARALTYGRTSTNKGRLMHLLFKSCT